MYEYKFSDEESKKFEEATKSLTDRFSEVDQRYSPVTADRITLDRMEYTRPTQEEVETQAKNSLSDYAASTKNSIENEYTEGMRANEEKAQSAATNLQNQKAEVTALYENAKTDADNDAIKRGLARSSIIVNIKDAFNNKMLDEYSRLNTEYAQTFEKLEEEKNLLERQKQSALDVFDLSYATKLNDKIASINKEIEEKEAEVLKYNNEIAQKEAEYNAEREQEAYERNQDYQEIVQNEGIATINRLMQSEKYNIAYSYLSNLTKAEAQRILNEEADYYRSQLGTYYNILKQQMDFRTN